jgi:hypothetical protein
MYVRHGKDGNHGKVMAVFEALCPVVEDHSQGDHGYDAIIRTSRGVVYVVEIKDGSQPPSKRRLTDSEKAAMARWGWQFALVESERDAERLARGDAFGKETDKRNERRAELTAKPFTPEASRELERIDDAEEAAWAEAQGRKL